MNGLETKVAGEVLKPAGSLMGALLSAKIEKLRGWANNKELLKDMKGEKLQSCLEKYVLRLSKRASELSTIVFPQSKIKLEDVYEPLKLRKSKTGFICSKDESECFIDMDGKGKSYFIIDQAGMGKSTYSKNLSLNLIKESDFIPILFDLSDYDSQIPLLENLAKTFDDIDSLFNRELFKKLIVEGYFFIILDAFDEAPIEKQDKLRKELQDFNEKKGDASLLVTSRPHERLPHLTDTESFVLEKLSFKQVTSLIERYDSVSGVKIGNRLIKELEKVPKNFLETPLLVGLLYRTYGFNNTIAQKISVFYSEIYDALYKGHDLTKAGYIRAKESNLDIDDFRNLLRSFSFLYIAKSSEARHSYEYLNDLLSEALSLCSFDKVPTRSFLSDLMLAVPLIYRDGNKYKFIHRSIAEYFAAEFISNSANKKQMLKRIIESPSRKIFEETVEYIYDLSPSLYQEVVTLPIAKKFLNRYSDSQNSDLYNTIQFQYEFEISYWNYLDVSKVSKNNEISIEIPKNSKSFTSYSSNFMYGNKNGKRYVACCRVGKAKINIPIGALMDLTEYCKGDVENLNYNRFDSDRNIIELISHLDEGVLYDDDSISKYSNLPSIIELLARYKISYSPKLDDEINSIRIISTEKCLKVINKVQSIQIAQEHLSKLIDH